MPYYKPASCVFCCLRWMPIVLGLTSVVGFSATGTIEGRVLNTRNGEYVEKARVTVEGTSLETFTEAGGQYRLRDVPAGPAKVIAFFTGFDPQVLAIVVTPGGAVQGDINLSSSPGKDDTARNDRVVKLDKFVVGASRQMEGAAIAINEQRFAPNIKNVVAADEFGTAAEGDIGEVLKFVPGVTIEYAADEARRVGLDGTPSEYTPVTMSGFLLANENQSTTNRAAALDQVSLNNISRIEVMQSPTPESPGGALSGSVNLVLRSAFERSKPSFNISTYVTMRGNRREFRKTAGSRNDPTYKTLPGFEFSYIRPVNSRFGFSLSGGAAKVISARDFTQNTWRGASAVTNGGMLPDTTPDRPYLSDYLVREGDTFRTKTSAALTLDYKLGDDGRVAFSIQRNSFGTNWDMHSLQFLVNRVLPENFSPTFTRGFAGAGEMRLINVSRSRDTVTLMPTLLYRHEGKVWKGQAGVAYSSSIGGYHDIDRGYLTNTQHRRTGVTVSFEDVGSLRPGRIVVTDAAGAPLDFNDVSNYSVSTGTSSVIASKDLQRSAQASLGRDFTWRGVPLAFKTGIDINQSVRDLRGAPGTFTFVGADGRASLTPVGNDDVATPFYAASLAGRDVPFGFSAFPVVSNEKLWEYHKANPTRFPRNENTEHINFVNQSKRAEETVSAAYLRGDAHLFDRRLRIVGGIRAEQTNIDAEGPLVDPTRNYQRDASGRLILGANGRPLQVATETLAVTKLTRIERGGRAEKEYLRWFPSINASFNVRENLIARAAYFHSLGRPDFNQYAAGLMLPDSENTTNDIITVNNAGIKAWTARSVKVSLEYYFERIGLISIGGFQRNFENFFGQSVFDVTPEFLELYGLDPAVYGNFRVSTQYNLTSTVRTTGMNINYKQALTFLPPWARGLQVFANGTSQRTTGDAAAEFSGYIPRTTNWGISLTREKFDLRVNWNHRGRQRNNPIGGRSIQEDTYNWGPARLYMDITGEHRIGRSRISVFAKLRNVRNVGTEAGTYGPLTPAYARITNLEKFGSLWTFGIKGTF